MSNKYVLVTDDSCDLPEQYLKEHSIPVVYLNFHMDGQTYTRGGMPPQRFYLLVRQGKTPTTTQVNVGEMCAFFEPFLEEGSDVLYLAFSSGLSGTCNSGVLAARGLAEKYPGRRVVVVDSLCASMGQGLLVHKARERRDAGATLDELAQWLTDNRLRVAHYVVAEDLMHLHRGGRVSRASAVVGSMLGIKPLIFVNNEGKLIPYDKARGRKQALNLVVEHIARCVEDEKNDICMISHADAEEEAQYVAELVRKRYGIQNIMIDYIGPVIGAHTGAGTVAVFLMAKHR